MLIGSRGLCREGQTEILSEFKLEVSLVLFYLRYQSSGTCDALRAAKHPALVLSVRG